MRAGWLQSAPMGHTLACERAEVHSLLILNQKLYFPLKHLFKQVSLLIGMCIFSVEIGERASPQRDRPITIIAQIFVRSQALHAPIMAPVQSIGDTHQGSQRRNTFASRVT